VSTCRSCVTECRPKPRSGTAGQTRGATLEQPAEVAEGAEYVVALAGNPNTGKSTVFNRLTGLRQHTGNWPGKTVARAEGSYAHGGCRFRLIDLPGTYSLLADSQDEQIARDFLLFGEPDCTVVVCDATVLERNLHLVLQVLQLTDRIVICTNLMDEADRKRISLEASILERELGVPVVPTAARQGQGLAHLKQHVLDVASRQLVMQPAPVQFDPQIEREVDDLARQLRQAIPGLRCARWIACRLLDGDERIEEALRSGELAGNGGENVHLPVVA
jgi:Fe2+ transport system protein B